MITRKLKATRQLRYLFTLVILTTFLFLYYASSSMFVKSKFSSISYQLKDRFSFMNGLNGQTVINDDTILTSKVSIEKFLNSTAMTEDSLLNSTAYIESSTILSLCPLIPPSIKTRIKINRTAYPEEEIANFPEIKSLEIQPGGHDKPKSCTARYKVGIVVPYRDRVENLKLFLNHIHPFLNKQQIEYAIYIVEPVKNVTFNRGLLMNIGFNEAIKETNKWDCFIFHDVDLLPEDERNIYGCSEIPRHFSSAVSTLKYKLPYNAIFGGVTGFTTKHFKLINGFSNLYFGWGGEDDDLRNRVIKVGLDITRYPLEIGRYYMAKHKKDTPNPERFKLLKSGKARVTKDGLTSLKYQVKSIEKRSLYTRILVDYNKKDLGSD